MPPQISLANQRRSRGPTPTPDRLYPRIAIPSEPLELGAQSPQAPLDMSMPAIELVEVVNAGAPFSRQPSHDEMDTALQYLGTRRFQRRKAIEDLTWSLMNSLEFIFNH